MLKRKQNETYAQHRARVLGITRLGASLAVLGITVVVLALLHFAFSERTFSPHFVDHCERCKS